MIQAKPVIRYALLLLVLTTFFALLTPNPETGFTTAAKFATNKDDTRYT